MLADLLSDVLTRACDNSRADENGDFILDEALFDHGTESDEPDQLPANVHTVRLLQRRHAFIGWEKKQDAGGTRDELLSSNSRKEKPISASVKLATHQSGAKKGQVRTPRSNPMLAAISYALLGVCRVLCAASRAVSLKIAIRLPSCDRCVRAALGQRVLTHQPSL